MVAGKTNHRPENCWSRYSQVGALQADFYDEYQEEVEDWSMEWPSDQDDSTDWQESSQDWRNQEPWSNQEWPSRVSLYPEMLYSSSAASLSMPQAQSMLAVPPPPASTEPQQLQLEDSGVKRVQTVLPAGSTSTNSDQPKAHAFYTVSASERSTQEPPLVASGAALHVCDSRFGSDYPLEPIPEDLQNLQLYNADGSSIEIYGSKHILFELVKGLFFYVQFIVCGISSAILSIPSLVDQFGSATFKAQDLHLDINGHRVPFDRTSMGSYLLTPFRRVPCSESKVYEPTTLHVAPVKQTRGYSGQADYWVLDSGSRTLTRIHKRLRQNRFNPLTSNLKDGCPLNIPGDLQDERTIVLQREGSTTEKVLKDSTWKNELQEVKGGLGFSYKGRTVFKIKDGIDIEEVTSKHLRKTPASMPGQQDQPQSSTTTLQSQSSTTTTSNSAGPVKATPTPRLRASLEGLSSPVSPPLRSSNFKNQDANQDEVQQDLVPYDQVSQDYWARQGSKWTRRHVQPRVHLYHPREDQDKPGGDQGPDIQSLLGDRVTKFQLLDDNQGVSLEYNDRWDENQPNSLGARAGFNPDSRWAGSTTFISTDTVDQVEVAHRTDQTQKAKSVSTPAEPSETERALRNLTHLPYRSCRSICVQAKARQDKHQQQKTRSPLIQCDFAFWGGDRGDQAVVLTAVDVQTGLASASIIPAKERSTYAIAELKKFIYECGRAYGSIQCDQEPAITSILKAVARERLEVYHFDTLPKDQVNRKERSSDSIKFCLLKLAHYAFRQKLDIKSRSVRSIRSLRG